MYTYDEDLDAELTDDFDYKESERKTHVMTKDEFMTRIVADLEVRKMQKQKDNKKKEMQNTSYIIDKMIYNRKKRTRR